MNNCYPRTACQGCRRWQWHLIRISGGFQVIVSDEARNGILAARPGKKEIPDQKVMDLCCIRFAELTIEE